MKIIKVKRLLSKKQLDIVKKSILNDELVIYPTETCYGIAALAESDIAMNKLLKYKGFRSNKPISILVSDRKVAEEFVILNKTARILYKNYMPGPMTVISHRKEDANLSRIVDMKSGKVGIRLSSHPIAMQIAKSIGKPVTATSANISDNPKPYSLESYMNATPKKSILHISLFVDYGKLPRRKSSTVVDSTITEDGLVVSRGSFDKGEADYMSVISKSVEDSIEFGRLIGIKLSSLLRNSNVAVMFTGDMGSGKTHLIKGIAKGLGIEENVKSPSYTIVNEYDFYLNEVRFLLYHLDIWRTDKDFTIDSVIRVSNEKNLLICIEWANKLSIESTEYIKKYFSTIIQIDIQKKSESIRVITTNIRL